MMIDQTLNVLIVGGCAFRRIATGVKNFAVDFTVGES
jgi:hypothetical protein